jgi:hypothetical protein
MTYMGGGVIRSATLCLAHLTHEMATQISSKVSDKLTDCLHIGHSDWLIPCIERSDWLRV